VTRVLGIEGTAWCASAAVFDADEGSIRIESDAYQPDSGGIHPREAAEHMRSAVPRVVEAILGTVRDEYGDPGEALDAVAFSRGPGLGPCLRIAGTAARALSGSLELPLVGVNHMVAHLEIGRHRSGFEDPICLNASGANAHVLGHHEGRYRVLGETMDTGVGNAIDKFTRHVGWTHPGGPKVEERARDGEYVDLPYVVKGMDFSFSGIMSAAKQAYDGGTPVENVCCGLQETIFAMLTEVSERALSLTGADELVLGGGVGQNDRLREMLGEMCAQRGADFFAPEPRFLRDNAGMIAMLGAKMYAAGDTLEIEASGIDSNFRPDEVPVTWRGADESVDRRVSKEQELQGAEATVSIETDRVVKDRKPRSYRHPALDERLRTERTRQEVRLTSEARKHGVPTPLVLDVDPETARIVVQRVGESDLREALSAETVSAVGGHLARIHDAGFVHGDPTTRNVRVGASPEGAASEQRVFLIDFGLGYYSDDPEDHAMDLHVLLGSLAGIDDDVDRLRTAAVEAYRDGGDEAVLDQLREIEGRGRYQ
jgi:N6-L-threonylcarbamoyladenine synthase/protein kinase Bud32